MSKNTLPVLPAHQFWRVTESHPLGVSFIHVRLMERRKTFFGLIKYTVALYQTNMYADKATPETISDYAYLCLSRYRKYNGQVSHLEYVKTQLVGDYPPNKLEDK